MKPTYKTISKRHYILGLATVFQYATDRGNIQKIRKEAFVLTKKAVLGTVYCLMKVYKVFLC